jgi:hypothetical protein
MSYFVFINMMRKKGVLQVALQLNFLIAEDTSNSLYIYTMNAKRQIA